MTPGLYLGLSIGLWFLSLRHALVSQNMSRHVREADVVEASHKPIFTCRPIGLDGLALSLG